MGHASTTGDIQAVPRTSQVLHKFKSFLLGSQDLKVNLCGLQQDKCSDGKSKKIVGIAGQFPRYGYTVGPYGKGPTSDYITCTYIASKYTAFLSIMIGI